MNQFCEILSIVLNKGSREEYEDLFNKVDVGKEGYVDWDKFCSHMLLEYYEKDDRMKTTQVRSLFLFFSVHTVESCWSNLVYKTLLSLKQNMIFPGFESIFSVFNSNLSGKLELLVHWN